MSEIDDEFIPCEICEEMIRFSDFQEHLRTCSRYDEFPMLIPFIALRLNNESLDEDIDYDELDNFSVFARITRQNQLSPGTNLRNFMETHFRPLRSSHSTPSSSVRTSTPHISEYEQNLQMAERIGKVEIGVKDINKISKIINNDVLSKDECICPICRDDLNKEKTIRILRCKHKYCDECIAHWLSKHKKCPVCLYEYE